MERRNKVVTLSAEQIQSCIEKLYSKATIKNTALASSGLANTNYIVTLDNEERVVLRIHSNQEANNGLKEFNIAKLLTSFPSVPKTLYFQPSTPDEFSFSIIQFIEGVLISEIPPGSQVDLEPAYFQIGLLLANFKKIKFNAAGLFDTNLNVIATNTNINNFHAITNYVLGCLNHDNLIQRTGLELKTSIANLIKEHDHLLQSIKDEPHIVHGDFKIENIMVRPEANQMYLAGVLDWEYARSGTSYEDIATLFRNDYDINSPLKRAFAKGYEANGAQLIEKWDAASKLIDLVNLCSFLCTEQDRPQLYAYVIENLNRTTNFFKVSS